MPPYKLLLTYYVWRMFEGHFLGIRRGVKLHKEEVTFFITFTNVFLFLSPFTFLKTFLLLFERFFTFMQHTAKRRRKCMRPVAPEANWKWGHKFFTVSPGPTFLQWPPVRGGTAHTRVDTKMCIHIVCAYKYCNCSVPDSRPTIDETSLKSVTINMPLTQDPDLTLYLVVYV